MNDKLIIYPQPITPSKTRSAKTKEPLGTGFNDALESAIKKQDELKFSSHVIERMEQRNIKLEEKDVNKLKDGVKMAQQRGVSSPLMLLGDLAFIASVKNKTIITAMGTKGLNHVFTGVDGVVIINE